MNIVKTILLGGIVYFCVYFGLPTWKMDNPNMWLTFLFWGICVTVLGINWSKSKATPFTWVGVSN